MKVRTLAWWLLACLLLVLTVRTLPLLLSTDRVRLLVLQHLESGIGHKIEADSLQLELFPRIGLELSGVLLSDRTSGERLFSARRMELVLHALPLLHGKLIGKRLLIEQPSLELHRDADGHWTMLPAEQPSSSEVTQVANPLGVFALVRNIYLTDGRMTLLDESQPGATRVLRLTAVQAIVTEGLPGRSANLQLFGEIPGVSDTATVSVEGTLIQTLRSDPREPPTSSAAIPAVQFEGDIRLHKADVRKLADWVGLAAVADRLHGSAHLRARLRLAPRPVGYDLIVSEWKADLEDLSVRGEATLAGIGTTTARYSATFSSSPLRLKRWLDQVPILWRSDRLQTIVSEHEIDGTVEVLTATVAGSMAPEPRLALEGQIHVREGRFLIEPDRPPIEGLSARILLESDQVRIQDLEAYYGPVHFSKGEALITDLQGDPKADLRLSGRVPAGDLIGMLAKTFKSPQIKAVLAHFPQADGEILLAAHLVGPVVNMGHFTLLAAEATIHDVDFRAPALRLPIQDLNGRLAFSSGMIQLHELSGRVGPAQIAARGRMRMSEEPVYEDLAVHVQVDGGEIAHLLQATDQAESMPTLEGPVSLAAVVSGPLQAPRIKGTMQLRDLVLSVQNVLAKSSGAPASVEFEGLLSQDLVLTVARLEVLFPPIRIAGHGRIHLSDEPHFEATFASTSLALEKLPRGISLGPVKAGVLDAILEIKGHGLDQSSWQLSGSVRLDDGLLVVEGMKDAIKNVSLRLKLDGDSLEILRLALESGGSDLRVAGSISNWIGAPRATLHVESHRLDLRELRPSGRPPQQQTPGPDVLTRWLTASELEAIVFVDHVSHEQLVLTGLSCRVRINHGEFTIDRISGDTDKGHVSGHLVVSPQERRRRQVETSLRVTGIPLQHLLPLFQQEEVMTGSLSLAGQIRTDLGRSGIMTTTLTSLKNIRVLIEQGRILKVPVISNLLKMLNLPALLQGQVDLTRDGLPFDQFRGIFSVGNGTVTIKEVLLNSPILKISGSGQYDLAADQFDMVLATSPLGSYADLLKRIPLFGKLLAGEREGFDTAVFEVTGSAADPQLRYLPAESLVRGMKGTAQLAFDILVNAITFPKEIVSLGQEFLAGED